MYTCNSRPWDRSTIVHLCCIIIRCKPRLWDRSTIVQLCCIIIRCIPAIVGYGDCLTIVHICVTLLFNASLGYGIFQLLFSLYYMIIRCIPTVVDHRIVQPLFIFVLHYYSMYTYNSRLWRSFNHCSLCVLLLFDVCLRGHGIVQPLFIFVLQYCSMFTQAMGSFYQCPSVLQYYSLHT